MPFMYLIINVVIHVMRKSILAKSVERSNAEYTKKQCKFEE